MKSETLVNKWFYKNFVHLRFFDETENIYDFVISSFVKCSPGLCICTVYPTVPHTVR